MVQNEKDLVPFIFYPLSRRTKNSTEKLATK